MTSIPQIDIIVVDYNAGVLTHRCIESVVAQPPRVAILRRVVVIDNGLSTPSASYVEGVNQLLTVIHNQENRGFAAACNQGAANSSADYLLFLNPDTQLNANSLAIPIQFMERPENSSVGICGVQLVDELGRVGRTCARFPTTSMFVTKVLGLDRLWSKRFQPHFMVEWDHSETRQVDQVMGAFFLVRRALFEALDGFDERFFVYFEEVDFTWRARKAGWSTYYVAEAQVYHRGGVTSEQVKGHRLFYSLRSRLLYGFKHFVHWRAWTLLAITLFLEPMIRSVFSLLQDGIEGVQHTLKAYSMLYHDLPSILGKARQP
jgi:N-acetylglucosaminyl-diphospho-decaprenol L-rhamnosyltransferase